MTEIHSFELGTDGPSAIVVGIDGSTTSLRASAYAAGLARRQRARLVAVYVGSDSAKCATEPSAAAVNRMALAEAFEQTAADLRLEAEKTAREHGISITFVATRGDSLAELHRIAQETCADAIVVGASTKPGHRLAGSLAVRLVRARKWPVTVVP
jgi:nucleotide-binding universal stress UspA family protein